MESIFNPNDLSQPNGNYFALPYGVDESKLVILSAPFDVTTSYRPGSANAPDAILDASVQIDLYDIEFKNNYQKGIGTLPFNDDILSASIEVRKHAEKVIAHLETGGSLQEKSIAKYLMKVNETSVEVNRFVFNAAAEQLAQGRFVALVGGDHSTPLGLIKAVGNHFGEFGILHIDAHADLREAFEGFTYSHASIMYNVLNEVKEVAQIVQVGVRDFCEEELAFINSSPRVTTFFDASLAERRFEGENWSSICDSIVAKLPQRVYISFDIDGMDVTYCPGTGTPVPGGLSFNEAIYLINKVVRSGRELIGFDVNEVSPVEGNEWDANVGARVLYKLSLALLENK